MEISETIENLKSQLELIIKQKNAIEEKINSLQKELAIKYAEPKAKKMIADVLANPRLVIFLSESENSDVIDCLLRIKKESEEKEAVWKIHDSDLAYNFTVRRTDRNGLDSNSIQWKTFDMGCSCDGDDCLSEKISFSQEIIPKCLETKIYFNTNNLDDDIDDNDIVEKWEYGSEYEHAHISITNIVCVGSTLAIEYLLNSVNCIECNKHFFPSELRSCGNCEEMHCAECLPKDVKICKECQLEIETMRITRKKKKKMKIDFIDEEKYSHV